MDRFLRAVSEAIRVVDAIDALVQRLTHLVGSLRGLAAGVILLLLTLSALRYR